MTNKIDNQTDKLKASMLFVDDEKNILSSLKRLFRPLVENIFIAESGAEGLAILNTESVDIIVSDMRMPEMDGAEFLEKVSEKWPDTIRILLTGYADITSTINAINKGSIYRYISKPWEDNDIVISVKQALEQKFLKEDRDRLLELTRSQNEELKDLTVHLEEKVKSRTDEVQQTMDQLEVTYETLKNNYDSTIKVFSSIIELSEDSQHSNNNVVSELAVDLAQSVGMSKDAMQQVKFACLLRNVGRIGFSDEINKKPADKLSNEEIKIVKQHPIIGHGILMSLDYLQDAAVFIRSQNERFDGEGFPDALSGEDIPLGARIIKLVSDYFGYQEGLIYSRELTVTATRECIKSKSGMRYDPKLVDTLFEIMDCKDAIEGAKNSVVEEKIDSVKLTEGMKLSKDLTMGNGVVLLNKSQVLNVKLIRAIRKMEVTMKEKMDIHIFVQTGED